MLITFSGLDGSGKTTLIARLKEHLQRQGRRVAVLTMYDNISFFSFLRPLRDFFLRSRPGADSPKQGSGKRRQHWTSLFIDRARGNARFRQCVYLLDLGIFFLINFYHRFLRRRVLILDRYFFDSLADITLDEQCRLRDTRVYTRIFLALMIKPDLPVLVDVDGEVAFRRKGEYSAGYNRKRRELYLGIFGMLPNSLVVRNDVLEDALKQLFGGLQNAMGRQSGGLEI